MKAKLIKTGNDYLLRDMSGEVLSITNGTIEGRKLSKQNCDEIFGVIDVEKLAEEDAKFRENFVIESSQVAPYRLGFRNGCNKAMELNKDKVFTEKDVVEILNLYSKHVQINFSPKGIIQEPIDFIKSLQQSKEIEVEIEMEEYGYCEGCRKAGMWHCAHADTCGYAETRQQPKLDESGCIILKKILKK